MDPSTLKPHVHNWRKHTPRQRDAFNALLSQVDWAGAILVNRTTGHILDGHMRVEEAIKKKSTVPVLYGTWTEAQEKQILLSFDAIGALAEINAVALASLTKEANKALESVAAKGSKDFGTITNLQSDLAKHARQIDAGESPAIHLAPARRQSSPKVVEDQPAASTDLPPDLQKALDLLGEDPIFESDNVWDIPELLPDMLCDQPPATTWDRTAATITSDSYFCYGAGPSTIPSPPQRNGGFLGFFTEDFRFEICWNDAKHFASRLATGNWSGVLAPDFSTWTDWPFAIRLHNIYRSRWCARYWQEIKIPVIPILQSIGSGPCEDDFLLDSIILETLPKTIPVLAVQVRTSEDDSIEYWEGLGELITHALSKLKVRYLVLYGGAEKRKYLEGHLPKSKTEFVFLPGFQTLRRFKHNVIDQ